MNRAISLLGSLLLSAQCGSGDAGAVEGAGAGVRSRAGAGTGALAGSGAFAGAGEGAGSRAGVGGQSDIRSNCSLQHVMSRLVQTQGGTRLGCVFQKKVVILGATGTGKSSLANSFLGWSRRQGGHVGPFTVGHGVVAGTTSSSYSSSSWLGLSDSPGVTVVDTPGFNSSIADMEELVWLLAELQEIDLFVVTFKYGDRFSPELARSLKTISKLLGSIWRNTVVVTTFWSNSDHSRAIRKERKINKKRYGAHLQDTIRNKMDLHHPLPVFFIDSHRNTSNAFEAKQFSRESSQLWRLLQSSRPWQSVTKPQLEQAIKQVKRTFGALQEKCSVLEEERRLTSALEDTNVRMIQAQNDLIQFLRKQIDLMKNTCL